MAEVIHRYIGKGEKPPPPPKPPAAKLGDPLDREYRIHRNEALQLKNHREKMLLAKARHELISKATVRQQAEFLLVSLRQRLMQIPRTHARRILNLSDYGQARKVLDAIMTGLLNELQDFPSKVTDPTWLEEIDQPFEQDTKTKRGK